MYEQSKSKVAETPAQDPRDRDGLQQWLVVFDEPSPRRGLNNIHVVGAVSAQKAKAKARNNTRSAGRCEVHLLDDVMDNGEIWSYYG